MGNPEREIPTAQEEKIVHSFLSTRREFFSLFTPKYIKGDKKRESGSMHISFQPNEQIGDAMLLSRRGFLRKGSVALFAGIVFNRLPDQNLNAQILEATSDLERRENKERKFAEFKIFLIEHMNAYYKDLLDMYKASDTSRAEERTGQIRLDIAQYAVSHHIIDASDANTMANALQDFCFANNHVVFFEFLTSKKLGNTPLFSCYFAPIQRRETQKMSEFGLWHGIFSQKATDQTVDIIETTTPNIEPMGEYLAEHLAVGDERKPAFDELVGFSFVDKVVIDLDAVANLALLRSWVLKEDPETLSDISDRLLYKGWNELKLEKGAPKEEMQGAFQNTYRESVLNHEVAHILFEMYKQQLNKALRADSSTVIFDIGEYKNVSVAELNEAFAILTDLRHSSNPYFSFATLFENKITKYNGLGKLDNPLRANWWYNNHLCAKHLPQTKRLI